MNRVLLLGHIGRPPEIKATEEMTKFAVLYLATNNKWMDSKGVQQTRTDWHRIVVWREKLVDFISNHLGKGSCILVEGKLQNRKFLQDDGTEARISEIVITQKGLGFIQWFPSAGLGVSAKQADAATASFRKSGQEEEI